MNNHASTIAIAINELADSKPPSKAAVIEQGVVVHCKDEPELYEYFYPFRRDWDDQKHRQALTPEEARGLFRRAGRRGASGKC